MSELETDGRLIKLKYEDLLTNIDSEMRRVYQFLDQTFDPEAIDAFTSQVRPGNFNKWKTQFTPSQLRVFEGVAGEVLRSLITKHSVNLFSFPGWNGRAMACTIWSRELGFVFDSTSLMESEFVTSGRRRFRDLVEGPR